MNPLEISVLRYRHTLFIISLATFMLPGTVFTQVAPTASERAVYHGLLRASAEGDVAAVERLLSAGATPDVIDRHVRRTPRRDAHAGCRWRRSQCPRARPL
jgi:hypothetical protein